MGQRYKFFALDNTGRVDRGFEKLLVDDSAAIDFAKGIEDAAKVEILLNGALIAAVMFRNGKATVMGG
jgi:hypothetical protein